MVASLTWPSLNGFSSLTANPLSKDTSRLENVLIEDEVNEKVTKLVYTSNLGRYGLSVNPLNEGFKVDTLNPDSTGQTQNTSSEGIDRFFSDKAILSVMWVDSVTSLDTLHNVSKEGYYIGMAIARIVPRRFIENKEYRGNDENIVIDNCPALIHQTISSVNYKGTTSEVKHLIATLIKNQRGYIIQVLDNTNKLPESKRANLEDFFKEIISGFHVINR